MISSFHRRQQVRGSRENLPIRYNIRRVNILGLAQNAGTRPRVSDSITVFIEDVRTVMNRRRNKDRFQTRETIGVRLCESVLFHIFTCLRRFRSTQQSSRIILKSLLQLLL